MPQLPKSKIQVLELLGNTRKCFKRTMYSLVIICTKLLSILIQHICIQARACICSSFTLNHIESNSCKKIILAKIDQFYSHCSSFLVWLIVDSKSFQNVWRTTLWHFRRSKQPFWGVGKWNVTSENFISAQPLTYTTLLVQNFNELMYQAMVVLHKQRG